MKIKDSELSIVSNHEIITIAWRNLSGYFIKQNFDGKMKIQTAIQLFKQNYLL
tara:strand:- start:53 stop:211 length:159 start_codon:yes stop_codon:yes gene_type:complete